MRDEILANKEAVVNEIADKFTKAQSAIIVEYRGLSVTDTLDLRRQLKAENVEFKVYKNTMTQRAVEKAGYSDLLEKLNGPNAIAFSDDAVAPSRILAAFARKKKALVLKAGVIEGNIVDSDKIKEISALPNRDGMIAMLLGCFQSPLRSFAYALQSIADQKTENGEVVDTKETKKPQEEAVEVAEAPSPKEENIEIPAEEKAVEPEETVNETTEENTTAVVEETMDNKGEE